MAMNQREKYLAMGVGLVASLFVGQYVVNSVQKGYADKLQKIDELNKKKQDQDLQITAGVIASQKLVAVVGRSLPKLEEKARADYMEWLIDLGESANLREPTPSLVGDQKDRDGAYHLFKFQLSGSGTIENATKLLHDFYTKDYLHRITRFNLAPVTGQPDQLAISMDCEAIALGTAKEKQPAPQQQSARIVKSLEEYKKTIVERNMFSPTNQPPTLEPTKVVEAKIGLPLDHTVEAKDPDATHKIKYELVGDAPKGLTVDPDTGKLTWSSNELGEFKVNLKATDSGLPPKSSTQLLTINVKEPPPPAKEPVKFDVASQSVVTALIVGKNGPEAWVHSKTDDKKFYLHKGDQLKLGGIEGKVMDVGANYVEFETESRRWVVGLDESIADAFNRGQID